MGALNTISGCSGSGQSDLQNEGACRAPASVVGEEPNSHVHLYNTEATPKSLFISTGIILTSHLTASKQLLKQGLSGCIGVSGLCTASC